MPDRSITQFTEAAAAAATFLIPIVDLSETNAANRNKKLPISKLFAPPVWNSLTLQNGWTVASGFATPAYRQLNNGQIELRGVIAKSGTPAAAEIIATLPTSYRPNARRRFTSTSSNESVLVHTVIDITAGGEVVLIAGGNSELSLEIAFSA